MEINKLFFKRKIIEIFSSISSKFINFLPRFNKGQLLLSLPPRNSVFFFPKNPDNGVERVQVLYSTSCLGFDHDRSCYRDHRIHILRRCRRELRTSSIDRWFRFNSSSSGFSVVSLSGKLISSSRSILKFESFCDPFEIFAFSTLQISANLHDQLVLIMPSLIPIEICWVLLGTPVTT